MRLKFVLTLLCFSVCQFLVFGQHNSVSIGPELNLPSGGFSGGTSVGFGATVKGELGVLEKFAITAQVSYVRFPGQRIWSGRTEGINAGTAKIGLKYYPSELFYLEGQLGSAFTDQRMLRNQFVVSPGVGTFLKNRNNGSYIDLGIRYENWNGYKRNQNQDMIIKENFLNGFFALRVSYAFPL